MINIRKILSAMMVFTAIPAICAAKTVVPLSISIKMKYPLETVSQTGAVSLNGNAVIDIVAKNNTGYPIEIMEASGLSFAAKGDYCIEVHHLHGSIVPVRDRFKDMYVNGDVFMPGLYLPVKIGPYGELTGSVSLPELINFDGQGVYVVIAKRKLPASLGGGWVTSNALQFKMPKLPDNPWYGAQHP